MVNLSEWLYKNKLRHDLFNILLHTPVGCLQRELNDCDSVLDLGCGLSSPLQYCNVKYSIGVDRFDNYIEKSLENEIHNVYINKNILNFRTKAKSFDAVIMLDVLEHLNKSEGFTMIKKMENWAKKKIIVSTPNGFVEQKIYDNNKYQKHLSGWNIDELKKSGFNKIFGMSGWKIKWRRKNKYNYKNKNIFWRIFFIISQIVTYYWPKRAFGLFCVKDLK